MDHNQYVCWVQSLQETVNEPVKQKGSGCQASTFLNVKRESEKENRSEMDLMCKEVLSDP